MAIYVANYTKYILIIPIYRHKMLIKVNNQDYAICDTTTRRN